MKRELLRDNVARFVLFMTLTAVMLSVGVPYWATLLTVFGIATLLACWHGWQDYRREEDAKPFGPEIERIP